MTSTGQKLSGPILKEKAENLDKKFGHTNFVTTEIWLSRWKARHQIKYKRELEEKGSRDIKSAEEWASTFYQGYWNNIGLMGTIMQMKLGCNTEPFLMAHFAIFMKNLMIL